MMAERTPDLGSGSGSGSGAGRGGARRSGLDTPLRARARRLPRLSPNPDAFGEATEGFARFMGTPQFLLAMTVFCAIWLGWNTFAPEPWRFDSAAIGFTALTLVLSLQASYAAPLLLLAQNRQDDRDKVSLREDRSRAERNLSDTEYLTRELAGLRIALQDVATRDFVRSEMRDAVAEISEDLRQEMRQEVRQELLAELGVEDPADDAGRAPSASESESGSGAGPGGPGAGSGSGGPGGQRKGKSKKKPRSTRERRDPEANGPQTTTLAIIAAEDAAMDRHSGEQTDVQAADQKPDQTDERKDEPTE